MHEGATVFFSSFLLLDWFSLMDIYTAAAAAWAPSSIPAFSPLRLSAGCRMALCSSWAPPYSLRLHSICTAFGFASRSHHFFSSSSFVSCARTSASFPSSSCTKPSRVHTIQSIESLSYKCQCLSVPAQPYWRRSRQGLRGRPTLAAERSQEQEVRGRVRARGPFLGICVCCFSSSPTTPLVSSVLDLFFSIACVASDVRPGVVSWGWWHGPV